VKIALWVLYVIAQQPAPPAGDPVGKYLQDLEAQNLVPHETGSVEKIKIALGQAEDALVGGDPRGATTILFGIVESPRFQDWSDTPEFQNAEYLLGRSLARGGAYGSARSYLLRALTRGPKGPYFAASYRQLVDVALETRDHAGILAQIDALKINERLPRDSENEHLYLQGKVAYDKKEWAGAEAAFGSIERTSRFYAASLYFRGLIRARKGDWRLARDAFCEIVEQPDKDKFAFYIDDRYFALKDLAYLALGRIAHEKGNYDEAYYFYFQVPDDSERLPDALFEAAWSMFQRGEWEASRTLLDQFDRLFPHSALAPDAMVLRANLDLKSCGFDHARALLEKFVKEYLPVSQELDRALADVGRRRALYGRLLGREKAPGMEGRILELLKVDPRFFRFNGYVRGLEREERDAQRTVAMWIDLSRKLVRDKPQAAATDALALLREVRALQPVAQGDPEAEKKISRLEGEIWRASHPAAGETPFAKEARAAQEMGAKARELRGRLVDAATGLADDSLRELSSRLHVLLRQARLGQIDAIVGKKKKLEIEISNLSKGRFPPEMFGKLHVEGLIGDDEEYWPYEGEYWSDEYENYK
jgi:tetratricopeptide (TPR) repeat protein